MRHLHTEMPAQTNYSHLRHHRHPICLLLKQGQILQAGKKPRVCHTKAGRKGGLRLRDALLCARHLPCSVPYQSLLAIDTIDGLEKIPVVGVQSTSCTPLSHDIQIIIVTGKLCVSRINRASEASGGAYLSSVAGNKVIHCLCR